MAQSIMKIPMIQLNLSPWIHSIYVVTFDIEFGQAIEIQTPKLKELELTEQERTNICYSSFPDSNSSILGSTQFHFRMKLTNVDQKLKQYYVYYNDQSTQALNVDTSAIFGYVHFLQRKDSTLKRGYFQKSLVVLSLLPFTELFYHVVKVVGTNYFDDNEKLLDLDNAFYNQVKKWPALETSKILELTIMGSNIAFYIPNKDDKLNSLHANLSPTSSLLVASRMRLIKSKPFSEHSQSITTIFNQHTNNGISSDHHSSGNINDVAVKKYLATSIHGAPLTLFNQHESYSTILTAFDLDLYDCFYSVISDLQFLWEMILCCESFIVIAHTPDLCSNFVQAMISLIYPFKFNADYRPFFTIHDPDFKEYTSVKDVMPNVILGVTNPFFTKSLEHWPNVVQLSSMTTSKSSDQLSSLISSFSQMNNQHQQPQPQPSKIPFVDRLRFASPGESLKPGLNTKLKPFLYKDRHFLTKILRSNKAHVQNRPNSVQTALIRRWLIELTQSFFMPLERYLAQLMPLQSKISAFKAPPELPSFDIEAFLSTLDTSGPQLTTKIKGDWVGLYKKFFASSNFGSWYAERKSEIDRKLWSKHMESFLDIDLPRAISKKDEVEVVDIIIKVRHRLTQATKKSHEYQYSPDNLNEFKSKLRDLIDTLPDDLRSFFSRSEF